MKPISINSTQAARILRMTTCELERQTLAGKIPGFKVGEHYRYYHNDLFINYLERKSRAENRD